MKIEPNINISLNETTAKRVEIIVNSFFVALIFTAIYLVFRLLPLAFPFLIAMILVSMMQPLVLFIHKKLKINQKALMFLILAILYLIIGVAVFLLITSLIFALKDIFALLPNYYQNTISPALLALVSRIEELFYEVSPAQINNIDTIRNILINGIQSFVTSFSEKGISFVTGFLNMIPGVVVGLIFTVLTSFFLSLHYDSVVSFIRYQFSAEMLDFFKNLKDIMKNSVFRYIRALFILMIITFCELTLGFYILNIDAPLPKALGIAIFDAFPVFGTGGILIPWLLTELLQGNLTASIGLAVLYAMISFIRYILEPKIVGDQLGMNPIVSLVAIYCGYRLFGIIGMITFPLLAHIIIVLNKKGLLKLYKIKPAETVKDPQTTK